MRTLLVLALMCSLTACERVQDEAEELGGSIAELTVSQIGSLASQILEDPSIAEEVLRSNGLTVERLDSLMYEIATDAEATADYLQALAERE